MAAEYEQAVARLRERLSEKSRSHSVRVAETAAALAKIYGVDPDYAALAGLLHDWDREVGDDDLVAAAHECGFEVCPVESDSPYLLHARTGAVALREEFPDLPDEVMRAIECHTVGAKEMSDLDQVVFIADMIEPLREFEGVDDLRELVGTLPLHLLFARAYKRSVLYLIETEKPIHPDTIEVWNAHVARWRS